MPEFDRYTRVITWAVQQPWALLPSKLLEFREFLSMKASGISLTDAEIQARIGSTPPSEPRASGAVAVIPVHGVITHRVNLMSQISGGTSTEKLQAQVMAAAADPDITQIVLDVNSPGGGVFGLPELTQTIREARAVKPVIAVVNAMAASAAYWLASAASEIVATPSAQVGSIGVFALHQDVSKALESEGVTVNVISAGKYKTETLPFTPLSDEAKAAIQSQVDTYYGMFVRDVAQGRQSTVAAVSSGFGEGRTINAQAALEAGMVDRIATFEAVIGQLLAPEAFRAELTEETVVAEGITGTFFANDPPTEPSVTYQPSSDFQRRRARMAILTVGKA